MPFAIFLLLCCTVYKTKQFDSCQSFWVEAIPNGLLLHVHIGVMHSFEHIKGMDRQCVSVNFDTVGTFAFLSKLGILTTLNLISVKLLNT